MPSTTFRLRTHADQFALIAHQDRLLANGYAITVHDLGHDTVVWQLSGTDRYVTFEGGGGHEIATNRRFSQPEQAGPWERLHRERKTATVVAYRCPDGIHWVTREADGTISATRPYPTVERTGLWEEFAEDPFVHPL